MGLAWKHHCRLGCIALLFASCFSFQNDLPRIPLTSPGLRWQSPKSTSQKSKRSCAKFSRRTYRNMFPYEPSPTSNFPINMSNDTSSDSNSLPDNISVNGNENKYFVQNITNNIKIEENNNLIYNLYLRY